MVYIRRRGVITDRYSDGAVVMESGKRVSVGKGLSRENA